VSQLCHFGVISGHQDVAAALEVDNNSSETNSPDIITIIVGYIVVIN